MRRGIGLRKEVALLLISVGLGMWAAWMLACVPSRYVRPAEEIPYLGFEIPEKKEPGSIKITVAVVNPSVEELLGIRLSAYARGFSRVMGTGLDEIVVAKGMTTKGPFESLALMTYPDKKGSDLTLTATAFVTRLGDRVVGSDVAVADIEGQDIIANVVTHELEMELSIALEMHEPLSGEKMWVKKIDLGRAKAKYTIVFERLEKGRHGRELDNTLSHAVFSVFSKTYADTMKTAWTYLDPNEMQVLKEKGEEIRGAKRY